MHDDQPVERWFDVEYWRSLNPTCSVSVTKCELPQPVTLPPAQLEQLRDRIDNDGYFELPASALSGCSSYSALVERLQSAVKKLVAAGWPASFVVIYDEAWLLVQLLSSVMRHTTGGNECMMDLVAWHVDPLEGQAGFTPHRDRHLGLQEQDTAAVHAGFRRPNGHSPRDCTCWVALSDATPDNGCLYILPRAADPAYLDGDCSAATAPQLMSDSFALSAGPMKQSVYMAATGSAWQHIRAVPCTVGSMVFFSHRVVHWGSKGRANSSQGPRISISFAASDHDFEVAAPYFDPAHLPMPPFRLRVALAAAQMLSYGGNGRFELTSAAVSEYVHAFKCERKQFSKHYRSLVKQATAAALELVGDEKQTRTTTTAASASKTKKKQRSGSSSKDKQEKKRKRIVAIGTGSD